MSPEEFRERKRALRRAMVGRILALDPEIRAREQATLTGRFAHLPGFVEARTVLLYVSAFPEEIATSAMLEQARTRGKRILCPRVDRVGRRLRLFEVDDPARDLSPGILGIPEPRAGCPEAEPVDVDWVLVPGLAFDARGYRLGRGAGHYDRLLATIRPDATTWGMFFDCQWVDDLPVEPHDIPLDGVISPAREVIPSSER